MRLTHTHTHTHTQRKKVNGHGKMLICLGGVCVPSTAIVPLILVVLKWVFQKLGLTRFLPTFLQNVLQMHPVSPSKEDRPVQRRSKGTTVDKISLVQALETDEELDELLQDGNRRKVVCKFTGTWCAPCKKIQPFFEQCASRYNNDDFAFRTIDVDEFDEIANKYKVSMMPTFLVLQEGSILGTYRGSNQNALESFLDEHL